MSVPGMSLMHRCELENRPLAGGVARLRIHLTCSAGRWRICTGCWHITCHLQFPVNLNRLIQQKHNRKQPKQITFAVFYNETVLLIPFVFPVAAGSLCRNTLAAGKQFPDTEKIPF